ncbi:MAG TPA: glycoside hydrolase domain-containing protein [Mycobacterium sp.]|nr:glycoside hydrolase domain-containing protein [Mycobacterium sp.]
MAPHILDTPNNVVGHFDRLRAAGFDTVIRYLAPSSNSWKVVGPGEARAIAAAGFKLALVFEGDGRAHGSTIGGRDGLAALAQAKAAGAPMGAVIYYTEDYDPAPNDIPSIIAAFKAFKAALGGYYRVGAYCSGYCASELVEAQAVDTTLDATTGQTLPLIWITQSLGFRGSRDYLNSGKPFVMFQLLPGKAGGLDEDPDITFHNYANENVDIGAFVPFAVPAVGGVA